MVLSRGASCINPGTREVRASLIKLTIKVISNYSNLRGILDFDWLKSYVAMVVTIDSKVTLIVLYNAASQRAC